LRLCINRLTDIVRSHTKSQGKDATRTLVPETGQRVSNDIQRVTNLAWLINLMGS